MIAYVGQTRSAAMIKSLSARGIGECTVREEFPPRRQPWFLDNGAYRDWVAAGRPVDANPFDAEAWNRTITKLLLARDVPRPDFIVAPDIVAGGVASLRFSLRHKLAVRFLAPVYLAVQDGMDLIDVAREIDSYDGLFVGGSLGWKLGTLRHWVALAHRFKRPCHAGRIGTAERVRDAVDAGVDSLDSCLPLFSRSQLAGFLREVHRPQGEQVSLW